MPKKTCIIGLLSIMAWFVHARQANEAAPTIPVCTHSPQIDGNLSDPTWQTALCISDFVIVNENGSTPASNVTAYVMCDNQWLYVGFDIVHPQPLTIVPKCKHHDEPVQRENCVKVALDPGTDGKLWYHFRLSAGNVRSEQRAVNGNYELSWDIPWRSATRITKTGWQAELALPFALLMEMGDPAKAKMNLLTHIFAPVLDPYNVIIGETREVISWAEIQPAWWRTPEKFIPVTGLDKVTFKPAFLPLLVKLDVGKYEFLKNECSYNVFGVVRNFGGRAGDVTIKVYDLPVTGETNAYMQTLNLSSNSDTAFELAIPVHTAIRRDIRTVMKGTDGEVLAETVIENPQVLNLFEAFLDRNYYTTETHAGVICRIGLPESALDNTRIVARCNGKLIGETREVKPVSDWNFSLDAVEIGAHTVNVALCKADGILIADQVLILLKRNPKPGLEWKIDRRRRLVLHNNEPYFAYGLLFGGWNKNVYNDENYKEIAEAGFNSIMFWAAPGTVEAVQSALDTVAKHNMHMVVQPLSFAEEKSGFTPKLPDGITRWGGFTILKGQLTRSSFTRQERSRIHAEIFAQAEPVIRAGVEAVKNHPALLAYESFDEPVHDNIFDQYVEGRKLYHLIHEVDGYHPVRVLWNSGFPAYETKYTDWSDIHARDPYWSPPVSSLRDSPNWMARETADLSARSRLDRKPVWVTPTLEMYSGHFKRYNLPEEQRAQTYLAILYEASGIFYFVYPAVHQVMWDMMHRLGDEIRALYPILTAPIPEHAVQYENIEVDVVNGKMPDVHAALRQNPEGGLAIMAVNSQPWPVEARFTLPFATSRATVQSKFEGRNFNLQDNAFVDTLEPFARRIYLVDAVQTNLPLTLQLMQTPQKNGFTPETAVPHAGRPNHKNIMPNPSFEESTLPWFPDYWFCGVHTSPTFPEERVGREKAKAVLDTRNPYHGKYSFRLNNGGSVYFNLEPQHDRPTPYVWSAWLRADTEGAKFGFRLSDGKQQIFSLTTDWQRYHVALIMPKNAPRHNIYYVFAPSNTVWIDAMQFEQGTEPTEFEP